MENNNTLVPENKNAKPINDMEIKLGNSFGNSIIAVSIIISIFSLIAIVNGSLFALFIFIVCLLIITTKHGIQIDFNQQQLKKYSKLFYSLKIGNWEDISAYTDITVMKFTRSRTTRSATNNSTKTSNTKYEVYILIKSHKKRKKIQSFDTVEEAKKYANDLSSSTYLEYAKYNPKQKKTSL